MRATVQSDREPQQDGQRSSGGIAPLFRQSFSIFTSKHFRLSYHALPYAGESETHGCGCFSPESHSNKDRQKQSVLLLKMIRFRSTSNTIWIWERNSDLASRKMPGHSPAGRRPMYTICYTNFRPIVYSWGASTHPNMQTNGLAEFFGKNGLRISKFNGYSPKP